MNGFFITGTDTGVGKTALSALLLAELRRRGIHAAPFKAAQTGCTRKGVSPEAFDLDDLSAPDLEYSLSMAGMTASAQVMAQMSPYRFEPACSPHLAAEQTGTEIDMSRIISAATALAADYELLLVEGAGGVLVPLTRRSLMIDLMQKLNLPVLLAARPGLGSINHTLLSIRALKEAQLKIAGVIFIASAPGNPGLIEKDNAATIAHFGGAPILGTIPFCASLQNPTPAYCNLPTAITAAVEKIADQLKI